MEYTLADIAAAVRGGDSGCCDGMNSWVNNPFMYMIFYGMFTGGGFGGFGGNMLNGMLTRAEMYEGFNLNQIQNDTRDIERAICNANTANLQGQSNILQAIASASYDAKSCCCDTNRNIDGVRYDISRNLDGVRYDLTRNLDALRFDTQKQTCDITAAIHADGEATRALITQNLIQGLRDQVDAKDRELLTANFQLSQQAQSATLVRELRPFPQPAYITCSPYQSAVGFLGCGCAC